MEDDNLEEKEAVMNFFRTIAAECKYDSVVVVGRSGDSADTVWYGDPMELYSMICLGKETLWGVIRGDLEPSTKPIKSESEEEDWDLSKL